MLNMDKRSEEILSSLIGTFIRTGDAVGSETLARSLETKLSSATIRNVMAELEKFGLLTHKYTSGGRLPTDVGMRYYVDKLLELEPLSNTAMTEIRSSCTEGSYSISGILQKASQLLFQLSNYAGLVVTPRMSEITIKHMEFIPLSSKRVLGIFVSRDGLVENRMIKVDGNFTYSDLERINNYCNRTFYGLTLLDANLKLEKELTSAQQEYDALISNALLLSQKLFVDVEKNELFVAGGQQLLGIDDLSGNDRIAALSGILEEKKKLIELLNNALRGDSVNIFIGSESGYGALSDCSVVSSSYGKGGKVLGALGVIGPMRMNYSRVVSVVDCTSKIISDFLDGEDLYEQ